MITCSGLSRESLLQKLTNCQNTYLNGVFWTSFFLLIDITSTLAFLSSNRCFRLTFIKEALAGWNIIIQFPRNQIVNDEIITLLETKYSIRKNSV